MTAILSRYTVALHSVALHFPGFGGVSQENRATPSEKGPMAPTFSTLDPKGPKIEKIQDRPPGLNRD